jgi:hypothetical protein
MAQSGARAGGIETAISVLTEAVEDAVDSVTVALEHLMLAVIVAPAFAKKSAVELDRYALQVVQHVVGLRAMLAEAIDKEEEVEPEADSHNAGAGS